MILRNKLPTRTAALAAGVLVAAVTVGCSQAKPAASGDQPSTTSQSASKSPSASAIATPSPVTKDGPCPYLPTADVMDVIGQHITRTTITSTKPLPGCAFYRPNGEEAAQITISTESSAPAAQQKALSTVTKQANPVNDIGDYGGVLVRDNDTILAVAKGTTLVVVKINQLSSLEAKELGRQAVAKL